MATPAGKMTAAQGAGKKSGRPAAEGPKLAPKVIYSPPAFICKMLFLRNYCELTTAVVCVHRLNVRA
jgi:hypothetical protein